MRMTAGMMLLQRTAERCLPFDDACITSGAARVPQDPRRRAVGDGIRRQPDAVGRVREQVQRGVRRDGLRLLAAA